MSADNFRRPKPYTSRRAQAIDGILGAPIGRRQTRQASETSFEPRYTSAARPAGRRLDDFARSDGYHAVDRPAVQLGETPLSIINKTISTRQPLSQTLDQTKKQRHQRRPGQRSKLRTWSRRVVLGLVLLVVISGGLLFAKGYIKLHKIFKGGGSAAALSANVDPSLLKGEGDGRVNILLLGIGGDGHDGPDLTDTMILASVDPVNNKAVLLSIPRDLWVKMPNNYEGNYQKINAAYEAGKYNYLGHDDDSNTNQQAVFAGFKSADEVVSQVLGVSINYNVLVNFQAFKQAVGTVGGITVDVPTELYDPTIAWENGGNPVIAEPGVQTFNGSQALLYVRSRETTSDFARAQRQRAVLVAIKQKVLTLGTFANPVKDSQLASAFGDNIVTDLSLSDGLRLYDIGKQISNSSIASIGLADPPNNYITTGTMDGLSIDEPTAGLYNYSAIQAFVRGQLPDGYIIKENAQIMVLNGTTMPGLATNEAALLKSYGYNIGTVADAPTQTYAKTVIVDLSKGVDKYTKNYLQQRFGVSTVTKLPGSSITPGSAKFVIILGQDEAAAS